jgi:protein-tyrosine phosphatase
MAMAVFNDKVKKKGLQDVFHVDSCGTAGYHIGELPDERTLKTANQFDLALNHRARQLEALDIRTYDYILAMDSQNHKNILQVAQRYGYSTSHIHLMRKFDTPATNEKVPDPYYGGMEDFHEVYHILDRSCDGLLQHVLEMHSEL